MTRIFTQTFGVVAAIIERDGKILLVREARRKGADHGKWNHPAGWVEVGENPIEAVKREVLEESGFVFTPTHLLGVYSLVRSDLTPTHHPIKVVFIGNISNEPQAELHDDVTETRWFTPKEIEAMDAATLRDMDIKQMVKNYFVEKPLPLTALTHTVVDGTR